MKTIFEKSVEGRKAIEFELEVPETQIDVKRRDSLDLPSLSEVDVVRHFTALSRRNFGVDNGFYPLGSCTMKYNPKINEDMSRLDGFNIHPLNPYNQGCLQLMFELAEDLKEICGMGAFTLQPAAGAHGELTGLMIIRKYFLDNNETRTKIITTDSSHGTNPASATMCGFETITIKSKEGLVDLDELRNNLDESVAAVMLTIPNTLGLFEKDILEISKMVHENGSLLYMDGANMNALLGVVRPGDIGVDVLHLNLHKTFSTPHGCGGPGSGPVGVVGKLKDYLPNPSVVLDGDYKFVDNPKSIGKVRAFYGNFGVLIKAYTYIKALGSDGLKGVGENAVINANYMKEKLKKEFKLAYDKVCMHEFVLSDSEMPNGVTTNDIAKRLLDYGYHPPTVYFPLIVPGAIMVEPTETESKEVMDEFISAMISIKKEAEDSPELVKNAPCTTIVKKLDAVKAAREPVLRFKFD